MGKFPEIKNLNYQALSITAGWQVIINIFFELDPDDDLKNREVINIDADKENLSPWEKVLKTYFFSN